MNAAIGPAAIHCFDICIFESSVFSFVGGVGAFSGPCPSWYGLPVAAETGRESSMPHTSLKKLQRISRPVLAIGAQIDCRVLELLCCGKIDVARRYKYSPPRAPLNKRSGISKADCLARNFSHDHRD